MDCVWPPGLLCSVDDSLLLFLRRRDLLTGSLCLSSASLLSPITLGQWWKEVSTSLEEIDFKNDVIFAFK